MDPVDGNLLTCHHITSADHHCAHLQTTASGEGVVGGSGSWSNSVSAVSWTAVQKQTHSRTHHTHMSTGLTLSDVYTCETLVCVKNSPDVLFTVIIDRRI